MLPLIPSYVTFITGLSLDDVQKARRAALTHSLLFILGFTIIFLALGATATALGRLVHDQRDWISRIGGVLIIVFGLYMLGVFNVALFSQERRVHIADKPVGYLGTLLVGIAFGAGWTPCIGPILGSILTYAASAADLARPVASARVLARACGSIPPGGRGGGAVSRLLHAYEAADGVGHQSSPVS